MTETTTRETTGHSGPTGIVMLNLGGPRDLDAVEGFLLRLFADREIIQLPFQSWLGPFIARRRTPKVKKLYAEIGGGSPIYDWTTAQGRAMVERLDEISPETAPHKFYVAFRYSPPFSEDALEAMKRDGVTRAVAFTQYPQFSCATTGSSLNELWRAAARKGLSDAFEWSVIDRWYSHPGFLDAMTDATESALATVPPELRDETVLLFSAHSLPLSVVDRGDAYPQEVGASVEGVLQRLALPNPAMLAYQSEVGPVRWLGPSTETVIEQLGHRGHKSVLVVPIAFTSDHIETLSELDIEYKELAEASGIEVFVRAPALNDDPRFLDALADVVARHLASGAVCSAKYPLRCPGCVNDHCRRIDRPIDQYERLPAARESA